MKIGGKKTSHFSEVSRLRGHENQRKLKHQIFVKFHVPGVMNIREKIGR